MRHLRPYRGIGLILGAFILLALAYSIVNPLHEATDELRHFRFVRYIAENGSLPVQGQEPCRSQSHHPPLIYVLGAAATFWIDTGRAVCDTPETNPFWAYRYADVGTDNKNQFLHSPEEAFPYSGEALAVHIVRAINVLVGAGVVFLTWFTGRTIWPKQPALALGAAAFVAFNPMFLYMSGAINNDIIAAFSSVAILFAATRLLRHSEGLRLQWGIVFGALYGLALMSKFNMAASIVLIEFALTWVAWRDRQWRRWVEINLVIAGVTGLLAGWWFVRNQILYGEPTGLQVLTDLWGVRDPRESLPVALSELPHLWTTLWGRFGFGQIPLPQFVYNILAYFFAFSLAGVVLPAFFRRLRDTPVVYLLLLVLHVLVSFAVVFNYMLVSPAGAMGRFFFPGLPAFALLAFYGLYAWLRLALPGANSARWPGRLAGIVNAAFAVLALWALFGYLAPAYARPGSFADSEIPTRVGAHFDAFVRLEGYGISNRELRPGEALDLNLYWEVLNRPPGNYLLFVHLIDGEGRIVTQRDTHPGLGKFPSSQWAPGDRFHERVRLYVPETAYAPQEATLSIGLYAPTYRLAISAPDGAALGDSYKIGPVTIQPWPGEKPNRQDQNFGGDVRLTGYDYSARELAPGDTLQTTLYWEALKDHPADYRVRTQLVDLSGRVWASSETVPRPPFGGLSRGQQVIDVQHLKLPLELPQGVYALDIALLRPEDGEPQNIIALDGHWIDNHLQLAPISVGATEQAQNE